MPLLTTLTALWLGGSVAAAGAAPPCLDDAAILRDAKTAFPSRYDHLMSLRQSDPLEYKQLIHNTTHVLDDPALVAALERVESARARLEAVAARLAKASDGQRDALEAELISAAEALVDARIAARKVRLEGLRQEMNAVSQEVRGLEQDRDAAVDAVLEGVVR